jgi:hypothetical protein
MSACIICPACGAKLRLAVPALGSTRVKCRTCGAKFYAAVGQDEPLGPIGQAPPPPAPNPVTLEVPHTRDALSWAHRHRAGNPFGRPKRRDLVIGFALIAGLVLGLGGLELYLLTLGNRTPVQPRTSVAAPAALNPVGELSSEAAQLVGRWESAEEPPAGLEFRADFTWTQVGSALGDPPHAGTGTWKLADARDSKLKVEVVAPGKPARELAVTLDKGTAVVTAPGSPPRRFVRR